MINQMNHNDTFAPLTAIRSALGSFSGGAFARDLAYVRNLAPIALGLKGVDRFLQAETGNFGITGVNAHAAVRMHVYPVTGSSWATCLKTKTSYFQRWKVASLR